MMEILEQEQNMFDNKKCNKNNKRKDISSESGVVVHHVFNPRIEKQKQVVNRVNFRTATDI